MTSRRIMRMNWVLLFLALVSPLPNCEGSQGFNKANWPGNQLLQTGFEESDSIPAISDFAVSEENPHSGRRCLMGKVTQPNQVCRLVIPFEGKISQLLDVSFWARGDKGTLCEVWIREGQEIKRISLEKMAWLTKDWRQTKFVYETKSNESGTIEISLPSSFGNAPVGQAWLDDVQVIKRAGVPYLASYTEDFPALTVDDNGTFWLACLERPNSKGQITVYRVGPGERKPIYTFAPKGLSGIGRPALAPLDQGCLVVFAAEVDKHWRLAYAFINSSDSVTYRFIESKGNSNIKPVVARAGERFCVLWESNACGHRTISVSWIDKRGSSIPEQLSSSLYNSYNPDLVVLSNGHIFAAWDSVRKESADIYGAWHRKGKWSQEQRLTSDPRIERHVSLAALENEVWMTWQAQSFPEHKVNHLNEQRIVVARLEGWNLLSPYNQFDCVSPEKVLLTRPKISFDTDGRLWMSARRSMGQHSGWLPQVWIYSGKNWSDPHQLWYNQGRIRPIPIVWCAQQGVAAVQRDDLPKFFYDRGKHPDWRSEVHLIAVESAWGKPFQPLQTIPLIMPQTDFTLRKRIVDSASRMPRQQQQHRRERLKLYWGDLHEHTDMSVCARAYNPPQDDLYANHRDIEKLDFTAITDHGYNLDHPQWASSSERVRCNQDPGHFLTFLAVEWTSDHIAYDPPRSYHRYGHHNLIFLDPHSPKFFDAHDGNISPRHLWDKLKGIEYITIPHQLADMGNAPTDWTYHDEHLQPLAEIWQQRGSYEYLGAPGCAIQSMTTKGHFLQDAWAQGIIIGVIASPDHGGGRGKVGVWARDLTRESLFEAFRSRRTFGTSGSKIALFVTSGDSVMGDKVIRRDSDSPIPIAVQAVAMLPIKEIVIFRNNEIVHRLEPNAKEVQFEWVDEQPPEEKQLWYYVRLRLAEDQLAWASPIWFIREMSLDR